MNVNFENICIYLWSLKIVLYITIPERWAQSRFQLPGYSSFHIVRDYKRGDGIALYVKNDLDCSTISSKSTAINGVFECVIIESKLDNCRLVAIACVYRALVSDVTLFCDDIDRLFNQVAIKKTIFICGDFNLDLLKHDSHSGTNSS